MTYKTILLPDWLERIIHALTTIPILTIELIHFLLTPIKWLKFKFHIALFLACATLGCYWYFSNIKNAFVYAAGIFLLSIIVIIILKWVRKRLKKIEERLLHYFRLYPLENVEINIPIINKKYFEEKKHEKEFKKHYGSPYHYYGSYIERNIFDDSNNKF